MSPSGSLSKCFILVKSRLVLLSGAWDDMMACCDYVPGEVMMESLRPSPNSHALLHSVPRL